MDLLKMIINTSNSEGPCFLCFRNDKNNLHNNTVFEIHNQSDIISVSIADMLKILFPSEDFVITHSCNDCTDLISTLYVLFYKRKYKIKLMNCLVKQLTNKIGCVKSPMNDSKVVLNLKLPSNHELDIKGQIVGTDGENNSANTVNHTLKDICHISEKSAEVIVYQNETEQEVIQETEQIKSHLKKSRKKRRRYHFCNDCNYKTLSKTTLQAHINKYHLHTRPHICQICFKGFFNKSNLSEHIKTHNNERNQTCELCGCSFLHKKSLIEHLRLHSDTRPYECSICNKKFVTSGRRSDHIKRSHMEKAECCPFCNKKYSLKKELTKHINNLHLGGI